MYWAEEMLRKRENGQAENRRLTRYITRLPNARMLNIWLNIKKQLLYEENKKSGNVMQQPMYSCVCGINASSKSILSH